MTRHLHVFLLVTKDVATKFGLLYYLLHLAWALAHRSAALHLNPRAVLSTMSFEYYFTRLPPMCHVP